MEQLFDEVVRLGREARLAVRYGHQVSEICSYRNGCIPDGISNASSSLSALASNISDSVDTPPYAATVNRGLRRSEALLNVAAVGYTEGVYTRDISKIFKQFGFTTMSSTQVPNTCKKSDEGFEPWINRDHGESPYLPRDAG